MTINCMHSIKDMIWVSWCVYVSTSFRCVVIISMQSCITFSPWCYVYDGRGGQLYNVFSSTSQKFPPELLKILVLSSPKMVHYQERGKNNNSCFFFNPYIQVVSWPHFFGHLKNSTVWTMHGGRITSPASLLTSMHHIHHSGAFIRSHDLLALFQSSGSTAVTNQSRLLTICVTFWSVYLYLDILWKHILRKI